MIYVSGLVCFIVGVSVGLWLAVVTFRTVFRAAREATASKGAQ